MQDRYLSMVIFEGKISEARRSVCLCQTSLRCQLQAPAFRRFFLFRCASVRGKVQTASCARAAKRWNSSYHSTFCHRHEQISVPHERKKQFDTINILLIMVLVVKFLVSNLHEVSNHFVGLRLSTQGAHLLAFALSAASNLCV